MGFRAWLCVVPAFLLVSLSLEAQNSRDSDAYCSYQMQQAEAQRDLLRTPAASAGLTQPETGLPTQVVGGASLSISNVKKAALTMDVARRGCDLYRSTTSVQQQLQYAVPMLERDALRNRLTLIGRASVELNALMKTTEKMMAAQNATRLMVFSLETTRMKLDADRADTQSKLASIYVPDLSTTPLKQMVDEKQNEEIAEQRAEDRLDRQNNWDLALQVGVHQQIDPVSDGVQPYGAFSLSYNLGSRAVDRHLDKAVSAYGDWKKAQEGDAIRNMEVLHQQLNATIAADEAEQQSLEEQMQEIDENLKVVTTPDTTAAVDFRNQLEAARLLLQIEAGDTAFRLAHLRSYCSANF